MLSTAPKRLQFREAPGGKPSQNGHNKLKEAKVKGKPECLPGLAKSHTYAHSDRKSITSESYGNKGYFEKSQDCPFSKTNGSNRIRKRRGAGKQIEHKIKERKICRFRRLLSLLYSGLCAA